MGVSPKEDKKIQDRCCAYVSCDCVFCVFVGLLATGLCCLGPLCTRVPLSDMVHVSVRQSLRRVGVNLGSLSRCRIRASMDVRAAHPCTCCRTPVCTKRQKTRWSRSPLEYSVRARLPSVVVLSLTSRSVWSHAYMHAHMCTHTRTCTHAPTHSTHTHTHTHTRICIDHCHVDGVLLDGGCGRNNCVLYLCCRFDSLPPPPTLNPDHRTRSLWIRQTKRFSPPSETADQIVTMQLQWMLAQHFENEINAWKCRGLAFRPVGSFT